MGKPRVAFIGSGGAVKGIAHIGVLRAMDELGLPVDVFVGSSSGAIAGAFYQQGFSPAQMVDWFRPFWRRGLEAPPLKARYFLGLPTREQLRQPGYLASGLLSIDRFERFVADTLPINDFRALKRHLLITAADVDGRGRVVFGRGYREDVPISQALAASSSIPLLFRPYRIDDRYYVDGEFVRTLSIDLAVEAGADVVVVSNVYRPYIVKAGDQSLVHRGAAAVGRQMLNVVLSEKEKRGIDLINRLYPHIHVVYVSPDLGRVPFMSRRHARTILARSYREALKVLAKEKRRGIFEVTSNVHAVGDA